MIAGARGDAAVECVLGNPRFADLVCQGSTIPRGITKRFDRVRTVLQRTAQGGRNVARDLRRARRLLVGAARIVNRKRRFGKTICGLAVVDRLRFALAQLARITDAG
jgi:hypothetical protein